MLQHQAAVRVVHRETGTDFGIFRTKTGGAKEGENQLVRPGGMGDPVAMPGTWAFGAVTGARLLEHEKDSGLVQTAFSMHGERFDLTIQRLDAKKRPGFHKPEAYSGLLNTSTPPDVDADGNDPSTLEMEWTIDSFA